MINRNFIIDVGVCKHVFHNFIVQRLIKELKNVIIMMVMIMGIVLINMVHIFHGSFGGKQRFSCQRRHWSSVEMACNEFLYQTFLRWSVALAWTKAMANTWTTPSFQKILMSPLLWIHQHFPIFLLFRLELYTFLYNTNLFNGIWIWWHCGGG